jgi:hypothetical protein
VKLILGHSTDADQLLKQRFETMVKNLGGVADTSANGSVDKDDKLVGEVARLQGHLKLHNKKIKSLENQLESAIDDKHNVQKKFDRSLVTRKIDTPPPVIQQEVEVKVCFNLFRTKHQTKYRIWHTWKYSKPPTHDFQKSKH